MKPSFLIKKIPPEVNEQEFWEIIYLLMAKKQIWMQQSCHITVTSDYPKPQRYSKKDGILNYEPKLRAANFIKTMYSNVTGLLHSNLLFRH